MLWAYSDYILYVFLSFTLPALTFTVCAAITIIWVKIRKRRSQRVEFGAWACLMFFGALTLSSPGMIGVYSVGLGIGLFFMWDVVIAAAMYRAMYAASWNAPPPLRFSPEPDDVDLVVFKQEGIPDETLKPELSRTGFRRPPTSFRQQARDVTYRARKVIYTFLTVTCLMGFLTGMICGFCLALHPFEISTSVSRRNVVCDQGSVCHVYFTLGPQCNQMYAVAHITLSDTVTANSKIDMEVRIDGVSRHITPTNIALRTDFPYDHRMVVSHLIDGLPPSTLVQVIFTVGEISGDAVKRGDTFKSLPCGTAPVRFWLGGDISVDDGGWRMCDTATRFDPDTHFVIIGGDMAYDNSIRACYDRYDILLMNWAKHMRRADNASIPFVTAVGNHDVGGYDRTYRSAFFADYFPAFPADGRPSFHLHIVAQHVGILVADTGHNIKVESQNAIIESTLQDWQGKQILPVIIYHVPAYPSQRGVDSRPTIDVREQWTPIFDRHNVSVVFENHDHVYKRTYPIRNQGIVPPGEGTVYIGDGAWGVSGDRPLDPGRWFIANTQSINYACHVTVSYPKNYTVQVVRDDGALADYWSSTRN